MAIPRKSKNVYGYHQGDYLVGHICSADGTIQEGVVLSVDGGLYTIPCNANNEDVSRVETFNNHTISARYVAANRQFDRDPSFHLPKRVTHAIFNGLFSMKRYMDGIQQDMEAYRREYTELERKYRALVAGAKVEAPPKQATKPAVVPEPGSLEYEAYLAQLLRQAERANAGAAARVRLRGI